MAQTRKRRRRKHRGTQGGGIDRRRARGRPRSREEAKARAKQRAGSRGQGRARGVVVPTWRSAFNRAAIGAVIFFVLAATLLKQPVAGAFALSGVMMGIYVPLGYYVDRFFYRRRLLKERQARAQSR
jgi:hypothetical protein